ncbi:hypothetical protein Rhe02_22180 [Rhizocola hellebori]|uniref:2TM domain-containing protein n=1 Tax=Rhizocola hellebori TaxID=1392758 RepID=A0A8J3VFF0_9ACTN|nr:hypothetical protein [Rhizocola hellebori]GIH04151.1 hypothetical protein Rhe02_22180 [Rhizocola hellebori]
MLLAVIIGCEIGFWVVLGAGLASRYLLRWRPFSTVLLLCVPLIDLVLLIATVAHLRSGATADWSHGLAAAYLGFSVAFGHSMMRWADQRFAHRFAGGPPPWTPPKYGRERTRYEWREWGKGVLGWAVACLLLLAGIWYVADPARTEQLWAWIGRLTTVIVIWLVAFPVSHTIWPAKPKPSS